MLPVGLRSTGRIRIRSLAGWGVRAILGLALGACAPESGPATTTDALAFRADCGYGELGLDFGEMAAERGDDTRNWLISAPHGIYDWNSLDLARRLRDRLGSHLVWARGYRTTQAFYNVNRPTGAFEVRSDEAHRIYQTYQACINQFEHEVYVEIHGNSRADSALLIEVATPDGFDLALATRIRDRWREFAVVDYPDIDLAIEPLDDLYWSAGGAKRLGTMRDCPARCLHLELPRSLREWDALERTAELLAAVLQELD